MKISSISSRISHDVSFFAEQEPEPTVDVPDQKEALTPAQKFVQTPHSGEKMYRRIIDYTSHQMDAFKLNKELTQRQKDGKDPDEFEFFFKDVDAAMQQFNNCVKNNGSSCVLLDYSITKFSPADTAQVEHLISQLDQIKREDTIIFVLTALYRIQDPRAIPLLVEHLTHSDDDIRQHSAKILMDAFKEQWDWRSDPIDDIVNALVELEDQTSLILLWDQTEYVLVKQLWSKDKTTRGRALMAFFRIGDARIVPELEKYFQRYASSTLAKTYYDQGNDDLRTVAVKWAHEHGYQIIVHTSPIYSSSVSGWGEM